MTNRLKQSTELNEQEITQAAQELSKKDNKKEDGVFKKEISETQIILNVKMDKSKHKMFKTYCSLYDVEMRSQVNELIDKWLREQKTLKFE